MHHRMLFQHLSSKPHAKVKHGGGSKALFCRKIMEACEAKDHGHDSKKTHHVEGPIMQAKEWMREFGWCNPWSTRSQSHKAKMSVLEENRSREEQEATQAGRPRPAGLPLFKHPGALLRQVSCSSRSLFVCSSL
jgi:hypothetical protein